MHEENAAVLFEKGQQVLEVCRKFKFNHSHLHEWASPSADIDRQKGRASAEKNNHDSSLWHLTHQIALIDFFFYVSWCR